jgi:putative DNA methylase
MAKERPDLLPYVGQQLTVIAWLWARTVASPNPAANGAHVPLIRSFWLATKPGKETYARPIIDRSGNKYGFEIRRGTPPNDFDPTKGTVVRTGATCLLTNSPIPFDHIRDEGKAGRLGSRLMAIVAEGIRERVYLPPLDEHHVIAESARPHDYPDTDLPKQALSFRVMLYGMDKHYKLFTARQLAALTTLSDLVGEAREAIHQDAITAGCSANGIRFADAGDGAAAYADAVATYLAFSVDRSADFWSSLCIWAPQPKNEVVMHVFGRQSLQMVWSFAETNPFSGSGGNFDSNHGFVVKALAGVPTQGLVGQASQADAVSSIAAREQLVVSTDPPYYDNIGYSDLSDFFYVWLRRSLRKIYPRILGTVLTPKVEELIASPYRHEGSRERAQHFFEKGLGTAFENMRRQHSTEIPLTVYYAFKQSESEDGDDDESESDSSLASTGWETMLEGVVRAGFSITGTWPMRTERSGGFRNRNQNALASSIVLVCRPRPDNASLATRKEFITALRSELPEALRNLQRGNIAPVDLAQAAIGPGMAVFTRYAKVLENDGSPLTVRTALGLINQSLDEVLAEQEGEFDSDTRWALAWFEQCGMDEGPFGDAETLSKAKNTAINGLVEAGVIMAKSGKVRLVKREELSDDWNPATDNRLTVWEMTQHLIRRLNQHGETGAADLVRELGSVSEVARDLAYRLYSTCERKKWAQDALAYNGLVVSWPEVSRMARDLKIKQPQSEQRTMFDE